MATAFTAFAATIALTILLLDEVLERHRARKWRAVGGIAVRRLSGDAFIACTGLIHFFGFEKQGERMVHAIDELAKSEKRPGYDGLPLLPEEFQNRVNELLEDEKKREECGEHINDLVQLLDEEIAHWASVMLQSSELAEMLNVFGMMREALSGIGRCLRGIEESDEVRLQFWVYLRVFFPLYASFDSLRRRFFGERIIFGRTLEEHDRVWGLPWKRPHRLKVEPS